MRKQTRGGFYISQIKQIMDRVFDRLLRENGIEDFNGPQGRILYVLWQEDNLPIRDLSRRTSLAKTSLTSMLDRMEAKGYLRRVLDAQDRRQTRIVLTAEARALTERYQAVSDQMSAIFYQGFSEDEITRLDDDLGRALQNLKVYEDEHHGTGNAGTD